jgi:5-amino-6-(5-phosphoribosylamino)uracil reductase
VIIGGGNLRAEGDHVWTAERICPELTGPYARARAALGKASGPLQVVVSASGQVDPSRRVFAGEAPSMVVTTGAGAERLRATRATIRTVVARSSMGWISLSEVLKAAKLGPGTLVLIESGPTSTTRFLAEGGVDELFLTRAPIFVGRASEPATLALVEGKVFRPGELSGRLLSLRRSGDYLFLRYAMNGTEPARRAVELTS